MEHNFIENELVILTKQTLDIFLKQKNPSELISLYTFYYYTAKWQHTNQPRCTTDYVSKGLNWSIQKVRKVKKQLIEFGLIEDARIVDEKTKKVTGYYIKMNYIFKKESVEKVQGLKNPPPGFDDVKSRGQEIEGVEKITPNALSTINKNALSTVIKERKEKKEKISDNKEKTNKEDYTSFIEHTVIEKIKNLPDKEISERILAVFENKKNKNRPITQTVLKVLLERLEQFSSGDRNKKIAILDVSVSRGYDEVYDIDVSYKKSYKTTYNEPKNASYDISSYENKSDDEYESYLENAFDKL